MQAHPSAAAAPGDHGQGGAAPGHTGWLPESLSYAVGDLVEMYHHGHRDWHQDRVAGVNPDGHITIESLPKVWLDRHCQDVQLRLRGPPGR